MRRGTIIALALLTLLGLGALAQAEIVQKGSSGSPSKAR